MNVGSLAAAVGEEGWVVGFDPGPGMVGRARERATAVDGRCSVVRGDAGTLPFPDGTFDRAFGMLAARAIPDAEAAVGEVARGLRPVGSSRSRRDRSGRSHSRLSLRSRRG